MPKADQYLLIQNHGEAPVEGYTILGYSSTRNCGVSGTIGQFGSGTKHAINLCLRNNLSVWIYCGKTRLEFNLEKEIVNDGLRDDTVYHVIYRKGNAGNWKRAGWVLEFGVLDWDNIGMALREFVSNAIDRTIREEGEITEAKNSGRLTVKIVDDNERRAKGGFTRVYVAVNDEVREYFAHLGKRFLHFSNNPAQAKPGLLAKANRNTEGSKGAVIYREGVWIRELGGESVYDYNFAANEIKINECRNSSEYYVKAACARKMKDAKAGELKPVFDAQLEGTEVFESGLDEDYLTDFGTLDETQKERWQSAWEAAAGPDAVVCDNKFSSDYVNNKGHVARTVGSNWAKALKCAGVKSATDVLSDDEQQGREIIDATEHAIDATNWAWNVFEVANLLGNKERPKVHCFRENMKAGVLVRGFQNDNGVHYHIDISDALCTDLKKTALEEVAHHLTGADDFSRDFQQFFIDTIVGIA